MKGKEMTSRRPRFAPVGFLVLMWMSAAHSQEQKNAAGSHADLMPEDLQKFNKLLEEDGFDIQSSDPTDWTKWATVLSHVFLTKENGDEHEALHALDRVMAQTRENLNNVMTGRVFDPVLAVTDDILYDTLPPEYDHLRPEGRPAESAAPAPAPSEEPPHEDSHSHGQSQILDPHDVEGVQFFKKGGKHGTQMKKIRKLAKPQTVVALLYRFKAFINYSPCVIQNQNIAAGFQMAGINIAPTLVEVKPELVSATIAGINFQPSLLTVAPNGMLATLFGVDVSPALAAILPTGFLVNPAGIFVAPVAAMFNPVGSLIGPTGMEIAPVNTLYSPRGRTAPDPVQQAAPALIAGTTYYVQHPDELERDIKRYEQGLL